jgi:hypothetical protein
MPRKKDPNKPKAKMGRPKKTISWQEVNKLLFIQCTDMEIAGFLEMSNDTLARLCKAEKGMTFAEYSQEKRERGKISLRRTLWQRAHEPKNVACLIFACKTLLGLKEHDDSRLKASVKAEGLIENSKVDIVLEWTDEDNA